MKRLFAIFVILMGPVLVLVPGSARASVGPSRMLDDFERIDAWKAVASDSVSASLRQAPGVHGKALCLDYDFHGFSGYAVAQRELPMTYPADYAYDLQLRGSGPVNNLEIKWADASGDNVWWVDKPNFALPVQWTPLVLKKRHITFAWGPTPDKVLRASRTFQFTISAGRGGGKGEACIDDLAFREIQVQTGPAPPLVATASAVSAGSSASNAVDGDIATAWRATAASTPALLVDLGRDREFGGLTLHWAPGAHASRYRVALSDDGRSWHEATQVIDGNGGADAIALPESEARYIRLQLDAGPSTQFALDDLVVEPLPFAETPNAFIQVLARRAPRGAFPRGFIGEQPYWTLVGVDGGTEQALLGEDGAIELAKGSVSLEPVVIVDQRPITWADVRTTQSLRDDALPIPSVDWSHRDFDLRITAFATGVTGHAHLIARYQLRNTGDRARDFTLAFLVRPMQVSPPSQFLNTPGGFSPIRDIDVGGTLITVNGTPRLQPLQPPDARFATTFDAGMAMSHLDDSTMPVKTVAHDAAGMASAALLYRLHLAPGETHAVDWQAPLDAKAVGTPVLDVQSALDAVAGGWHATLDHVSIRVPAPGQHLVDTLHTALADMLISRVGPRLQPGTRSYARAWIRDGAMISEALLRLGRADVATDFIRWYAPYQFDTGKVPCCVDDRGSDPVPENDSQGELIFAVAEVYRYTRDRAFLQELWPHVSAAVGYMDTLRLSQRTDANRAIDPASYGLMPASISHEGYSSKPMHSYWDDFWSLRGYDDAVAIAGWMGHDEEARHWKLSRDQFRGDLHASILAATRERGIGFIPGSAELGDFDATSTTIALAPGGEQGRLPRNLLHATFERYWAEFTARRDGQREWKDYTPYELRTIGSFVRLGWRERAWSALAFFMDDQQPVGWNQWAEVVSHTPRKPFFLGDLPHAWVASDAARSILDLFAYERPDDQSLVLAAGIPTTWLRGDGIAISGLQTPYGTLSYALRERAGALQLTLQAGAMPPGGFRLPWPYAGKPGMARIDGHATRLQDGALQVPAGRHDVEIALPHR